MLTKPVVPASLPPSLPLSLLSHTDRHTLYINTHAGEERGPLEGGEREKRGRKEEEERERKKREKRGRGEREKREGDR